MSYAIPSGRKVSRWHAAADHVSGVALQALSPSFAHASFGQINSPDEHAISCATAGNGLKAGAG